ncbi:MAG: CHAD domain-containing protein [Anaerolineaceae bacterium]|nr:CHAD domain-containing protein [Anaerolineaceae bacterium]
MIGGQELRRELEERLTDSVGTLQPDDPVGEAGRKVLLREFRKVLAHEEGSRSGADIEDLHQLRVAMRKSRSVMRLLRPWYRTRVIRRHNEAMRSVMRASGPVRDLDVLREDLLALDRSDSPDLQQSLVALDRQRTGLRGKLLFALYSDSWEQFLLDYTDFLVTPGAGVSRSRPGRIVAQQARHVLPLLVQQRLTRVLAYGPHLADADDERLHDLRIQCKRLRYALSSFDALLGPDLKAYVVELKRMQDHLGRLNDIAVAGGLLPGLMPGLDFAACEFLYAYRRDLEEERGQLLDSFPTAWERFTSRETRLLLAQALLQL